MFERILFPTDFSAASQAAADRILTIPGVQEVHVLHAIDTAAVVGASSTPGGRAGAAFSQQAMDAWHDKAVEQCARIAETFESSGLQATFAVEWGDPVGLIVETAEAQGFTAIVLGATGKGRLAEALLGSVSDHVLRRATIPVLIVKR